MGLGGLSRRDILRITNNQPLKAITLSVTNTNKVMIRIYALENRDGEQIWYSSKEAALGDKRAGDTLKCLTLTSSNRSEILDTICRIYNGRGGMVCKEKIIA
jgi:hypothetical protein